jgi:serine phosphatase RsbU (regulator of sigma subunit)
MFEELVPDRDAFDALTPEQRQEIFERINQRMQGVQQGIDVLRKELESRTVAITEIRTQGATDSAEAVLGATTPAPATTAGTQARPAADQAAAASSGRSAQPAPAPPPPAPSAPRAPTAPAAPVTQRSTELSGGRLVVRVERDSQLVGEVGADVDLPMLLATVFETTSRERGEVPFAVGEDGELYTPTESDKVQLEALQTTALRPATEPGTTILPDWIVATTPDPTGSGLKFGIARPVGDALRDLQQTSARNAGLGMAFIGLALIAIVPLSGRLTRNLDLLGKGVNRIAQGDYSARVQVRSNDEVGQLARAFNLMAADVEKHHRSSVEQERIRRELELGRQIQHDMLPQAPLRLGLTEVKGVSVPAREVGGDFFNYFQLQDGTIALLVGDVSGKGVGAALLMANIQAALRTRLSLGQDLASLAQELDVDIDRTTPGPVYATLFVGILDPVSRHLRCVNAGHNPQYILRTERRLERMESTGRPIGLYSGGGYTEQHFDLAAGDVLFFYTDGCVEAENASGEMFGSERLEDVLAVSAGRDADQVIVAVEADVSRFRAGVELQDDATMMVVKVG